MTQRPKVTQEQIDGFVNVLLSCRQWYESKVLFADRQMQSLFKTQNFARFKRLIREAASQSDGRIMSWPGSAGYLASKFSTTEDFEKSKAMVSEAEQLLNRFNQIADYRDQLKTEGVL